MDKNGKFGNRQIKIIVVGIIIGLSLVIIVLAVTLAIFLKATNTTAAAVTTGNVNTHFSRDMNSISTQYKLYQ